MTRRDGAAVLVHRHGGVLAISRGDDMLDWGLPAGGLDPGENFLEAACRELLEETGLDAAGCRFRALCWFSSPRGRSACFELLDEPLWPHVLASDPWEGHVAWVAPQMLVRPTCSHADHNVRILAAAGLLPTR